MNENLPFGGVGFSGMGALHGKIGFDSTSHMKPVLDKASINSFPLNCRFPPYTPSKQALMKTLMKYTNFPQKKAIISIIFMVLLIIGIISYQKGHFKQILKVFTELNKLFFKNKKNSMSEL